MTFLCTIDGELVPGENDGVPRTIEHNGATSYDWPQPWAFLCDECDRVFPYSCNAMRKTERLAPPTMRHTGPDRHRCAFCEGYVEPFVQLDLFGAAA